MTPRNILLVAGTRPNFVKAGPLMAALRASPRWRPRLLVVGQHRDDAMSREILEDLSLVGDDIIHLPIISTTLGARLGTIIDTLGAEINRVTGASVVVFGDVDTTLAGAIAAKRAQRRLIHVEAGLRSGDRCMPEELNRLMVDAIADLLLATSEDACDTLVRREGHPADSVYVVGNLMIDALLATADRNHGAALRAAHGVAGKPFALATFHRPSNVDDASSLKALIDMLHRASQRLDVVLPIHPRTAAALVRHGLEQEANSIPQLHLVPPMRYRDFVSLLTQARVVLTDSGGLQEETSVLAIPCLTVRENTERPVTINHGSNLLVEPNKACNALDAVLSAPTPTPLAIPGWDGDAAGRILDVLNNWE